MQYQRHSLQSVFLGTHDGFDLYFDNQDGLPTVIARYGNGAADYKSGLYWADFDHALRVAKELSLEKKLIAPVILEESADIDDEIATCPVCLNRSAMQLSLCEVHAEDYAAHLEVDDEPYVARCGEVDHTEIDDIQDNWDDYFTDQQFIYGVVIH